MENAQKKALRAGLPFFDNLLAAFATYLLLAANYFPKDCPEWYGKNYGDQTWDKWMVYFGPLHLALEQNTKAETRQGENSRTAAADSAIHGITTSSLDGTATITSRRDPSMTITEKFDGHFESLESADTNRNVVPEWLIAATKTQ